MGDVGRPREHKKRDMWARIPWKRRQEISDMIHEMPESNEKIILELALCSDMSTTDIAYYCADNGIKSRRNQPYSRRRIQQIIAENVPDYNAYQRHSKSAARRKQHFKALAKKEKTFCGLCGCSDNLELHHMIPVFLGGTESDNNLIWLCHNCHSKVTRYQQEQFKEVWWKKEE